MVRQGHSKWGPMHGRVGQVMHAKVGWGPGGLEFKLAQHRYAGATAFALGGLGSPFTSLIYSAHARAHSRERGKLVQTPPTTSILVQR